MKIKKILIANRSEVASRVIFACKSLNIKTVAIYCKEDRNLAYNFQADENHELSGSGANTYLNQNEIIKIAKKLNVDAIHPGYGFLSENSIFAKKVIDTGIKWIGPNPEIIKLMGNKINARNIMQKNNVPVIPAEFITHSEETFNVNAKIKILKNIVNKIGLPVILKDPLGGGGKGIRTIFNASDLANTFNTIKSESARLTGSTQILVEKYIKTARHIEIQIAGDGKNFIHMYERECSTQRRHQKIIEEAPCIFLNKKLLNKIYKAAIKAISAIKYNSIGTVEFIVTPDNNFYFLEMNTRLQVEHSVTEETTGIDLVLLQIDLAQNKKLKLKQSEITLKNHAIECRIYAEDTNNNFTPNTGIITNLEIPNMPRTRIDHNLEKFLEITANFDPMLAKITCSGQTRDIAIKNTLTVLNQTKIDGLKTNIDFLKKLLQTNEFVSGQINTQTVESDSFKKNILKDCNNNKLEQSKLEQSKLEQSQLEQAEIAAIFSIFIKEQINKQLLTRISKNWGKRSWQ